MNFPVPIVPRGCAYVVDATGGGAVERLAAILLEAEGKPLSTPVVFCSTTEEGEAAVESMLERLRAAGDGEG